jgi:transcriptional regulator with XRE-family HTH domain
MHNPIEILKGHLSAPGAKQADLATQIGISPQYLSEILKGKRNPSKTVLDFLGLEKVVSYQERAPAARTSDRRTTTRRRA